MDEEQKRKRDLKEDFLRKFLELDLKEIKNLYVKLAHVYHPDKGGDLITMQALNMAYEEAIRKSEEVKTPEDLEIELDLMEIIKKINHLEGITIEVLGRWIWVTGETKSVKEELKKVGFLFARKKVAWFYRKDGDKVRNTGGEWSLNKIRGEYGSIEIKKNTIKKLK